MAVNPSPPPTPIKPEPGKYKFRGNHEVSYCLKINDPGAGVAPATCTQQQISTFKQEEIVNSTTSFFDDASNLWLIEVIINGNVFNVPSSILEKVDNITPITSYSLVEFPIPETTTSNSIVTTKSMSRNTIIIISVISALVVVGILRLLKVI